VSARSYLVRLGKVTLSSALALGLVASQAEALGPLERNHPVVAQGMKAYEEGRYDDALAAFEAAQRERPDAPQLDLNRGDALYKLKRLEEARLAYERAAGRGDPSLQQRSLFNLGNTLATLGKRSEALAAYRKALLLDPKDAQARRNLELLLKNEEPPKPNPEQPDGGSDAGTPPPDGGTEPDGGGDRGSAGSDGGSDGGPDGGADGGSPESDGGADGGADGGTDGGQAGADGGTDAGGSGPQDEKREVDGGAPPEQSEQAQEGEASDAGIAKGQRLSEDEAKRLLDSMKESERSLQLWRFQKKKPRTQNEKDW